MRKRWRTISCLAVVAGLCGLGGHALAQAQYPQYVQYPQSAPPVAPAASGAAVILTAGQLDQLLAPIALYPDPLLALMLPAATFPQQVVAAEQWLSATSDPTEASIAAQSWDDSVKGLVHYPDALNMMSGQIGWTQAVGAAFLAQQPDVLASVQRLRAEAQAAGTLQNSPEQQVVADGSDICVEPADPNTMYEPYYNPDEAYSMQCPVTYGNGRPIGLWCLNGFDWRHRCILHGGGWFNGWPHPAEWDRRWPGWDRRPAAWVAAPKPWVRATPRTAPRLTAALVSRALLARPNTAVARMPETHTAFKMPATPRIGNQPAPELSRNAFAAGDSRSEVESADQRARSTPRAEPAAGETRRAEPVQRAPVQAQPAFRPPMIQAAPQPSDNNAFSGGSGASTRAESNRGNASTGRNR